MSHRLFLTATRMYNIYFSKLRHKKKTGWDAPNGVLRDNKTLSALYKDRGQTRSLQFVFNSHRYSQAIPLVTLGEISITVLPFLSGDWSTPLFTIHRNCFPERYSIGNMPQYAFSWLLNTELFYSSLGIGRYESTRTGTWFWQDILNGKLFWVNVCVPGWKLRCSCRI